MKEFEFTGLPWRVVFGRGAVQRLPALLRTLGLERPLYLSTPGRARQAAEIAGVAGMAGAGHFSGAVAHVLEATVEAAGRMAEEVGAGCTVSVGGGSTTGLGKALRLRYGLPQLAIPTTYSGSEMTSVWGITEGNQKRTGRDPVVLPRAVIYDPDLLASLPLHVAGPSAMNALAQAVPNLDAAVPRPMAALFAGQAFEVVVPALRRLLAGDDSACSDLLYGACLGGAALGCGRVGLHHRVCHVLGGLFNLPHADTHAVILPYSVVLKAREAEGEMRFMQAVLGEADAAAGLHKLMERVCRRPSLRALGLGEPQLEQARAAICSKGSGFEAAAGEVSRLLAAAWRGEPPGCGRP